MPSLLGGMTSLSSYGNLSSYLISLDLNNLGSANNLFNQFMSTYIEKFQAGKFYHVYNRAVGAEKLFFKEPNYGYFLSLYQKRLSPLVDTYAYCLLPNHFHLLISIRHEFESAESIIGEMFRRFSIAYAQAINVQENRKGSLFMKPFKRIQIKDDYYLTRIITYIHQNPSHHGLGACFQDYKWSSYRTILSRSPTLLKRNEVLEWFGGKELFIKAHRK